MAEYRYLIVRGNGTCEPLHPATRPAAAEQGSRGGTLKVPTPDPFDVLDPPYATRDVLPQLLAAGWAPLRETGLGDGSALVVLQKP